MRIAYSLPAVKCSKQASGVRTGEHSPPSLPARTSGHEATRFPSADPLISHSFTIWQTTLLHALPQDRPIVHPVKDVDRKGGVELEGYRITCHARVNQRRQQARFYDEDAAAAHYLLRKCRIGLCAEGAANRAKIPDSRRNAPPGASNGHTEPSSSFCTRKVDAPRGFEPRLTESESVVLPLDDGATRESDREGAHLVLRGAQVKPALACALAPACSAR